MDNELWSFCSEKLILDWLQVYMLPDSLMNGVGENEASKSCNKNTYQVPVMHTDIGCQLESRVDSSVGFDEVQD